MEITSIPLKIKLELAKENIDDSMDMFNSELVGLCDEYLQDTTVSLTQDNKVTDLSPRKFAHIIASLAFSAFEKASEGDGAPFKVEVDMPNKQLKAFQAANRSDIKELERLQKLVKKPVTNEQILDAINSISITNIVESKPVSQDVAVAKETKKALVAEPDLTINEGSVKGTMRATLDL